MVSHIFVIFKAQSFNSPIFCGIDYRNPTGLLHLHTDFPHSCSFTDTSLFIHWLLSIFRELSSFRITWCFSWRNDPRKEEKKNTRTPPSIDIYSEPLIVRAASIHFHIFSRVTHTLALKTQVSHVDKFLWPSRNILIPLSNRQRELWSPMERIRWIIFHVIILLLLFRRYSLHSEIIAIFYSVQLSHYPNNSSQISSISWPIFDCFSFNSFEPKSFFL